MKVAVIGAGAAGSAAAITAARLAQKKSRAVKIDLFEQNEQIGRKILASGNGRCNISNRTLQASCYIGQQSFIKKVLLQYNYERFEHFADSLGLVLRAVEDGRVYPLSNEAKSVHRLLGEAIVQEGVCLYRNMKIEAIYAKSNGFALIAQGETIYYDRIVLATGSPSAPQLGGCDDGWHFAKSLGHRVHPPYAALVGLELEGNLHTRMQGAKKEVRLDLYVDGHHKDQAVGDLLFTKYGLSGFAVLDLSIKAAKWLARGRSVTVGVDLLPDYQPAWIDAQWHRWRKRSPQRTIESFLCALLPIKMVKGVLHALRIDKQRSISDLEKEAWHRIVRTLHDWRFRVRNTHGFGHAEVSGGGVVLDEVHASSMASKQIKGLFFAGELLDVVGRRGGYNLHFAWASGTIAGEHVVLS